MGKISDKFNIATADSAPLHQHAPIYSDHFTSQCFMRPAPILALETIPKRKVSLKVESFARFAPMPKAVFGRANFANRCFFVPYRTIFRHFNDFIVNSPSPKYDSSAYVNVMANVPTISVTDLIDLFFVDGNVFVESGSSNNYDFQLINGTSSVPSGYYLFTDQGIFLSKVLRSLGYPLIWDYVITKSFSVLPLLAYIKVIFDWYYPSSFAYGSLYAYFDHFFDTSDDQSRLDIRKLAGFFLQIAYCQYQQDYFTSSWTNPVGPNSTDFEGRFSLPDIANSYPYNNSSIVTIGHAQVVNDRNDNGTPSVSSTVGGSDTDIPYRLNQYMIDALRSLTDYTVRHRLSGVRTLDRTLAEFGVNLASEIAKRSIYIGYNEFPCQFGDNMSTADTDGARLGDYSGKGVAYDRGAFDFDGSSEFGMLIIVNSVVPQVGYYQGYDRHVDHITALDFYHGDFDHLGVQALSKGEVMCQLDDFDQRNFDGVFGFVPRYAEYHVYNDRITGMPSLRSLKDYYGSMYLQRDLTKWFEFCNLNSLDPTQRLEFILALDYMQYNRLFYADTQSDNIDVVHHFQILNTDTAKDLFDVYDFEKAVNTVKMNINGSNLQ